MIGAWLIHPTTGAELAAARKDAALTPEQVEAYLTTDVDIAAPRIMRISGDIATIDVVGTLTRGRDAYAFFYGGGNTTYSEIVRSIELAEANPSIKRVVLLVDSPGGQVSGLFATLDALRAFTKPLEARVLEMCCSAAYAIASACNRIVASGEASTIGSIGVAATYVVYDDEVTITSTNAPNKRPDLRTDEGKAVVRKELDDIHELFVASIAKGRKTTAEKVNADFGRGGVFLAREAKAAGMIDRIAPAKRLRTPAASPGAVAMRPHDDVDTDVTLAAAEKPRLTEHERMFAAQAERMREPTQAENFASVLVMTRRPQDTDLDLADRMLAFIDRAIEGNNNRHHSGAPVPNNPEPKSKPKNNMPPNADIGDQVIELRTAREEGREPEAWATKPLPEREEPESTSDLGDAVVELMEKERAREAGRQGAFMVTKKAPNQR